MILGSWLPSMDTTLPCSTVAFVFKLENLGTVQEDRFATTLILHH